MRAIAKIRATSGRNHSSTFLLTTPREACFRAPVLLAASDQMQTLTEGSPNVPQQFGDVTRPDWVDVRFTDEMGATQERRFIGVWSTSVQHQIDHLDGRLFFDRMTPMRKRKILEAHRKARGRRRG